MICAIGAYTVHNNTFDVVMMLVFGVAGYLLKKTNYPLAPMVLAIVLGDKAEEAFRQSLLASQGGLGVFFSNGLVGTIMTLGLIALFWPLIQNALDPRPARRARLKRRREGANDHHCTGLVLWNIVLQYDQIDRTMRRAAGRADQPESDAAAGDRADRHLVQLQEQGLCGA